MPVPPIGGMGRFAGAAAALLIAAGAALAPTPARAVSSQTAEYEAALRLAPHLAHGAELFQLCAACHGRDGTGSSTGRVPAIAGQSEAVLIKQLVEFRFDTRHSIRVQGFIDHHQLAPQDLADVTGYVSSLPPRRPASMRASPQAAHGAGLFRTLCANCHGARGASDPGALVPRLAGQHRTYLAEQLRDAAEGRRPSMSRDHARLLAPLSSDDLDAIAEYLAELAPDVLESPARPQRR